VDAELITNGLYAPPTPIIVVGCGNIRYMQILAGVPLGGGLK